MSWMANTKSVYEKWIFIFSLVNINLNITKINYQITNICAHHTSFISQLQKKKVLINYLYKSITKQKKKF